MSQVALSPNNFESKFLNTNSEPKQRGRFVHIDPSYYNKADVKAGDADGYGYILKVMLALFVTAVTASVSAAAVLYATASIPMAAMTFLVVAGIGALIVYNIKKS